MSAEGQVSEISARVMVAEVEVEEGDCRNARTNE